MFKTVVRTLTAIILCMCICISSLADTLVLPAGIREIPQEAFRGDTSLDEVVLPDRIERIEAEAFTESSIKKINLPESLTYIDENAFDAKNTIKMVAAKSSYARDWCLNHLYLAPVTLVSSSFLPQMNGESISANRIFQHDPADGDIHFSVGLDFVRRFMQEYTNGTSYMRIFGYCLNEEPDFNDETQIQDRVGDLLFDETFEGIVGVRLLTQMNINEQDLMTINTETQKRSRYIKVHFALCNENKSAPDVWWSFGLKIAGSLDEFTLNLTDDGTYMIEKYTGADKDIVIPDTYYDGIAITRIGNRAFEKNTAIETVILPETITSIGDYTFSNCTSLHNITLNEGLQTIGEDAFYQSGITSVSVPDTVTSIGSAAFAKCKSLERADLPSGMTAIPSQLFDGCESLASCAIPDTVTVIGDNAFRNCKYLGKISIPDGVTKIGMQAFEHCSSIRRFIIPESVNTIDMMAFVGCDELQMIFFKCSEKQYNTSAFSNPKNITTAFYCKKNSTLWNYLNSRGFGKLLKAWDGTEPQEEYIDGKGFVYTVNASGKAVITGYNGFPTTDTFVVPGSIDGKPVEEIGAGAFKGNKRLVGSLVLPLSLKRIGDSAFEECKTLAGELVLPEGLTTYGKKMFYRCGFTGNLVIPEGVTEIPEGAFWGNNFNGQLTLPSTIEKIQYRAFRGTDFTGRLILPNGLQFIGGEAFYSCTRFTGVIVIPESCTTINNYAFRGLKNVEAIYVPSGTVIEDAEVFRKYYTNSDDTDTYYGISGPTIYVNSGSSASNCLSVRGKDLVWKGLLEWTTDPWPYNAAGELLSVTMHDQIQNRQVYSFIDENNSRHYGQTLFLMLEDYELYQGRTVGYQLNINSRWRIVSVPDWLYYNGPLEGQAGTQDLIFEVNYEELGFSDIYQFRLSTSFENSILEIATGLNGRIRFVIMPHPHSYSYYYDENQIKTWYCVFCHPRTQEQMLQDLENASRYYTQLNEDEGYGYKLNDSASLYLKNLEEIHATLWFQIGQDAYNIGTMDVVGYWKDKLSWTPFYHELDQTKINCIQNSIQNMLQARSARVNSNADQDFMEAMAVFVESMEKTISGIVAYDGYQELSQANARVSECMAVLNQRMNNANAALEEGNYLWLSKEINICDEYITELNEYIPPTLINADWGTRFLTELTNFKDVSRCASIALKVIKEAADIVTDENAYLAWTANRKKLFYASLEHAEENIEILQEIRQAFSGNAEIKDYCDTTILTIQAYLADELLGSVAAMNTALIDTATILVREGVEATVSIIYDEIIASLFTSLCGSAGGLVTAIPQGLGFVTELVWGVDSGYNEWENVAILYDDIEDFADQYREKMITGTNISANARVFGMLYLAELKLAGLQKAKSFLPNSVSAINSYMETLHERMNSYLLMVK